MEKVVWDVDVFLQVMYITESETKRNKQLKKRMGNFER